jgi:hypothetical protein
LINWRIAQHHHSRQGEAAHFFQLLDRIGNDKEDPGDREEPEGLKQSLSRMLWEKSLDTFFELNRLEAQNHA